MGKLNREAPTRDTELNSEGRAASLGVRFARRVRDYGGMDGRVCEISCRGFQSQEYSPCRDGMN